MKKGLFICTIFAAFFISGCTSSKAPFLLKKHFLTELHYLYTEIPEPMEIDLAFLGREFSYNSPIYSSEQNIAIFPFMKDNSTIYIKALSNSYIQNENKIPPPQSANDTEYIKNHITYSMNALSTEKLIDEIIFNNDKKYGYTCTSTQNGEKVFCQAVLITSQKNVVAIEMERVFTGSTEYLKDILIQAIESVKPVEVK